MDKISAYKELTELNRSYLDGIAENSKILKEVALFSRGGWDYKWFYVQHENAGAYFSDENCEDYTHKYLMRENKSEGRLEQVVQGMSDKVLKLGDRYKEYVKSAAPLVYSDNMPRWSSFMWEDDDLIYLRNARVDSDWIYFTWDPIAHLNTRRDDPMGYPMKVKYDGSGLQILSRYQMEPNWRGIYGFEKAGDYIYYITNRKLIEGTEEQFTLHRVKTDGSDEKNIAEVMYFDLYKDKIYYRQPGENGEYDSIKFYSINLDGTGNKLLSEKGAFGVKYYGDNLYYTVYGDKDGVYTMKTDGSGVRKIGDVQGDLLYADDKYLYYDYNYYDHNDNGGRFKNMGKYRIDILTGKKEKAQ